MKATSTNDSPAQTDVDNDIGTVAVVIGIGGNVGLLAF